MASLGTAGFIRNARVLEQTRNNCARLSLHTGFVQIVRSYKGNPAISSSSLPTKSESKTILLFGLQFQTALSATIRPQAHRSGFSCSTTYDPRLPSKCWTVFQARTRSKILSHLRHLHVWTHVGSPLGPRPCISQELFRATAPGLAICVHSTVNYNIPNLRMLVVWFL